MKESLLVDGDKWSKVVKFAGILAFIGASVLTRDAGWMSLAWGAGACIGVSLVLLAPYAAYRWLQRALFPAAYRRYTDRHPHFIETGLRDIERQIELDRAVHPWLRNMLFVIALLLAAIAGMLWRMQ